MSASALGPSSYYLLDCLVGLLRTLSVTGAELSQQGGATYYSICFASFGFLSEHSPPMLCAGWQLLQGDADIESEKWRCCGEFRFTWQALVKFLCLRTYEVPSAPLSASICTECWSHEVWCYCRLKFHGKRVTGSNGSVSLVLHSSCQLMSMRAGGIVALSACVIPSISSNVTPAPSESSCLTADL